MKSRIQKGIDNYLNLRRSLGFKLIYSEKALIDFALFLKKEHAKYITTKLSIQWAMIPKNAGHDYWARRLSIIRLFTRWWHIVDSRTEVPAEGLIYSKIKRHIPYILSNIQILNLLKFCKNIKKDNSLRSHTCYSLFGLMTVTGMRIGEAISLKTKDVDLSQGILTVRQTKFNKSRFIPVHDSTCNILNEYLFLRAQYDVKKCDRFFISDRGTPLTHGAIWHVFNKFALKYNLKNIIRIHDLRHRFAVKTLIQWYRSGIDVNKKIQLLSTYLGHSNPSATYWYISATPELMGLSLSKYEKQFEGGLQ